MGTVFQQFILDQIPMAPLAENALIGGQRGSLYKGVSGAWVPVANIATLPNAIPVSGINVPTNAAGFNSTADTLGHVSMPLNNIGSGITKISATTGMAIGSASAESIWQAQNVDGNIRWRWLGTLDGLAGENVTSWQGAPSSLPATVVNDRFIIAGFGSRSTAVGVARTDGNMGVLVSEHSTIYAAGSDLFVPIRIRKAASVPGYTSRIAGVLQDYQSNRSCDIARKGRVVVATNDTFLLGLVGMGIAISAVAGRATLRSRASGGIGDVLGGGFDATIGNYAIVDLNI